MQRIARRNRPSRAALFAPTAIIACLLMGGLALAQGEDDDEEDAIMEMPAAPEPLRVQPRTSASVTAGGAQDINHARQLIAAGQVPNLNAIVPEGLLSEHDLPVEGPECTMTFCARLSAGYAPAFDSGRNEIWIQLGFGSNIDLEAFSRGPLNAAIVLDRSGSMGGEKMEVVRTAALAMLERMGPEDRLALVSYASTPEVDLASTQVTDSEALERVVRGWATGGSTNLEGALELGYREVARHAGEAGYENRVIVFTDMLPNVGMTSPDSFRGMSSRFASEGINLTVIGVGSDFGQELGLTLSELRGGNTYFLRDRDEAQRVFGEELDFMVTPVAYDVDLGIEAARGFELTGVYGVPNADDDGRIETHLATLFLSQRGGAILMRFIPSDTTAATWSPTNPISNVTLEYTTVGGERRSQSVSARLALPAGPVERPMFEQHGPYRAWALVQQALIMRAAIENAQAGNGELAVAQLTDLAGTLRTVATETGDEPLSREADLVEQLLQNIQ